MNSTRSDSGKLETQIQVTFENYDDLPVYPQPLHGPFQAHVSILDALMCVGPRKELLF